VGYTADRQPSGSLTIFQPDRFLFKIFCQILDLSENNLSTLDGMENLLRLKQLYANWNRLCSLAELPTLPDLHILSVSGNAIKSFDGMSAQVFLCRIPRA
jgi:hypothetical protein